MELHRVEPTSAFCNGGPSLLLRRQEGASKMLRLGIGFAMIRCWGLRFRSCRIAHTRQRPISPD